MGSKERWHEIDARLPTPKGLFDCVHVLIDNRLLATLPLRNALALIGLFDQRSQSSKVLAITVQHVIRQFSKQGWQITLVVPVSVA
jgi:hypothetical protein